MDEKLILEHIKDELTVLTEYFLKVYHDPLKVNTIELDVIGHKLSGIYDELLYLRHNIAKRTLDSISKAKTIAPAEPIIATLKPVEELPEPEITIHEEIIPEVIESPAQIEEPQPEEIPVSEENEVFFEETEIIADAPVTEEILPEISEELIEEEIAETEIHEETEEEVYTPEEASVFEETTEIIEDIPEPVIEDEEGFFEEETIDEILETEQTEASEPVQEIEHDEEPVPTEISHVDLVNETEIIEESHPAEIETIPETADPQVIEKAPEPEIIEETFTPPAIEPEAPKEEVSYDLFGQPVVKKAEKSPTFQLNLYNEPSEKTKSEGAIEDPEKKAVYEKFINKELSLNERLAGSNGNVPLGDRMQKGPISNIRSAITLNMKLSFIKELYGGDQKEYNKLLAFLDKCRNYAEARLYIQGEMERFPVWQEKQSLVNSLMELITRRFQ